MRMRPYVIAVLVLCSLAQATAYVEQHHVPVVGASKKENFRAKISVYHHEPGDGVGTHAFHKNGKPVTMEEVVDKIVKGLEARKLSPREAEALHKKKEDEALESLHKAEVASERKKERRKARHKHRKKSKKKQRRYRHHFDKYRHRRFRDLSEPRTRSYVQRPNYQFRDEEGSDNELRSGLHSVPRGRPPFYSYKLHAPVVDFYGQNAGHGLQEHEEENPGRRSFNKIINVQPVKQAPRRLG